MGSIASVVDGIVQQQTTKATDPTQHTKNAGKGSSMDKDAFLQLLVAQMKYQDPLEPTSNTEYISQYANFSELEQMQNMSSTLELSRAAGLVGQTVTVEGTDDNGNSYGDTGVVDYITYENQKALVWVNGSSYKLEDVKEVADAKFVNAASNASVLLKALNALPAVNELSIEDKTDVEAVAAAYNGLSDYEKSFISKDNANLINSYIEKLSELVKLSELDADNNNS